MDKTAEQIAAGLNSAQRAFILNASKRPKKWMTIRRHAKIVGPARVHSLIAPLRLMAGDGRGLDQYALTPLGIAVRAILQEQSNAD